MTQRASPELQAAFNHERAQAQATRELDNAGARAQTMQMYQRLETLQVATIARDAVKLDCARGCSYCCHLRVEIRPHDAFVLARHIEAAFDGAQRARALARIEDNLVRIARLTPAEHVRAGIPCALLVDGACSVYEGRPATCRKYYSVSVETCRNAFNDTSLPLTGEIEDEGVRVAGNAVALGYAKGLDDVGYDARLYELHHAVHVALTQPQAEKIYREGGKAFG